MSIVQSQCNLNEGVVNKLLIDDKGLLVLAVFGLPPMPHEDDPSRAVATGALICKAVDRWQLKSTHSNGKISRAVVGVASGMVYCGVTGAEV
jgi:hypothetical protein